MSLNKIMDTENVVHLHNVILFSYVLWFKSFIIEMQGEREKVEEREREREKESKSKRERGVERREERRRQRGERSERSER